MPSTTPGAASVNWLVAVGDVDPSVSQTSLQLDSGRIVSIPTALLLEPYLAAVNGTMESSLEFPTAIPVIAEELVVTKRLVSLETVRLTKSSEYKTERVEVPIAKERWEITRVPTDTEVAGHSEVRYDGDTAIYPVFEERVMTRKGLFLVEEIHVRKVVETTSEIVESSLMHEVVTIERVAP